MPRFLAIILIFFIAPMTACAQETPEAAYIDGPLGPFEALMGTWTGHSTDPNSVGSDTMHFEWILAGQAVQHTHAVGSGMYGGRTIYFFDNSLNEGSGSIIYHYFTTAGFHTQGTAWWEGDTLHAYEEVIGHPSITGVDGIVTFNEDGTLTSQSNYLDGGEWTEGHGFHYRQTPDAEIVFTLEND